MYGFKYSVLINHDTFKEAKDDLKDIFGFEGFIKVMDKKYLKETK